MEAESQKLRSDASSFLSGIREIKPAEIMLCLSIISVFVPYKVYPVFFLASSLIFFLDTKQLEYKMWAIFLALFSLYAAISFLVSYDGDTFLLTNIFKLLVNFVFLYFAINWLRQRDNARLLRLVDYSFHLIFVLVAAQLMVYHEALDFRMIYGSSSSGQASMLYAKDLFFWGLDDKNMFGARLAMLGFPYILLPLIRKNKIALWRIILIFALAYLSLSRTPIVALLIGCGFLLWISSGKWMKIAMVVVLMASASFILEKVLRVDQLTASNDGMGIRLVYYKAFFQHFDAIPVWGKGFLSDPEFLAEHAEFYRGEQHIHNTFMTNYIQMGVFGLVFYTLFLFYFIKRCFQITPNHKFWIMVSLPMLAIMLILYTGYENDVVLYLILIFLLGTLRQIDFKTIKTRL